MFVFISQVFFPLTATHRRHVVTSSPPALRGKQYRHQTDAQVWSGTPVHLRQTLKREREERSQREGITGTESKA